MTWEVREGDCVALMAAMDEASVDAIVCDPPYGLEFMGKDWDRLGGARIRQPSDRDRAPGAAHNGSTSLVARNLPDAYVAGARAQGWHELWAREALRVLKPGGFLLAFGGTRTYHRLACAVEDAGFEIRDSLLFWGYGTGFPKSLDVSKAIDKAAGAEGTFGAPKSAAHAGWIQRGAMRGAEGHDGYQRPWMEDATAVDRNARQYVPATSDAEQWDGWGTALKPAYEPIVMARKPLAGTVAANVLAHGTGALNIDGCRVVASDAPDEAVRAPNAGARYRGVLNGGKVSDAEPRATSATSAGRWPANVLLSHSPDCVPVGYREVRSNGHYPSSRGASGYGSAVEGSNGGGLKGQDGLEERRTRGEGEAVWACVPGCPVRVLDEQAGERTSGANPTRRGSDKFRTAYGDFEGQRECVATRGAESGGASRFFYTAKASRRERNAGLREGLPRARRRRKREQQDAADRWWPRASNRHPTVKPIDVMRWLVRLVVPPGGVVLDPFAGSGTTGCAAVLEGFDFVGVDREPEYVWLARARIGWWEANGPGRAEREQQPRAVVVAPAQGSLL